MIELTAPYFRIKKNQPSSFVVLFNQFNYYF